MLFSTLATAMGTEGCGPGVYPPLHLEPEDSGSADAPVIYEGRQGASLSAGVHVPPSAFKKWDGHPNVVQADLSSLGLTYGEMGAGGDNGGTCTQFTKARLFFENRTQILARWPNVQSFDPSTYQWQKIGVGGADGFTINDTATVARASKWAAEAPRGVSALAAANQDLQLTSSR